MGGAMPAAVAAGGGQQLQHEMARRSRPPPNPPLPPLAPDLSRASRPRRHRRAGEERHQGGAARVRPLAAGRGPAPLRAQEVRRTGRACQVPEEASTECATPASARACALAHARACACMQQAHRTRASAQRALTVFCALLATAQLPVRLLCCLRPMSSPRCAWRSRLPGGGGCSCAVRRKMASFLCAPLPQTAR